MSSKTIAFRIFLVIIFLYLFTNCNIKESKEDAIKYNKQMKKECPCEKYQYISKGYYKCECN